MNQPPTILILEDEQLRAAQFIAAIHSLQDELEIRIWRDAPTMIQECPPFLASCRLISLDHDLNSVEGDPGTGLDVTRFLAEMQPTCPIIIHTSNTAARWSMHNELRFANIAAEIVGPLGDNWISESWLPKVATLLKK